MPFHGAINHAVQVPRRIRATKKRAHRSVLSSRNHCCTVATVMV
jgi:hypothetical protein